MYKIHKLNIEIHIEIEVTVLFPCEIHAEYQNQPQKYRNQIDIKAKSILTFSMDFVYGQWIVTLISRPLQAPVSGIVCY